MSPTMLALLILILFIVLLSTGIPVAFSLGISGFIGIAIYMGPSQAISMLAIETYRSASSFSYAVIPLFVVMGMLVMHTGMSKDIYDCLGCWNNRLPGGQGVATVWSCTLFGMLNGSAAVTSSVFARAAAPELLKRGYNPEVTYGMIASAGCIGQFIPPSIVIILYGGISDDSIGRLLMAAISPGLAMSIVFSLVMVGIALFRPDLVPRTDEHYTMWYRIKELRKLLPVLIVGGLIVVGLATGAYSTTEAGAAGALVFVIYAIIHRVPFKTMLLAFRDAASTACMMFIIMGCGSVFAKFVTLTGLGKVIQDVASAASFGPGVFMLIAFVIYLVLGCFIDPTSILTITLPLLLPIVDMLGINRIHYAMFVIMALHVGGITPPVGLTVFFTKAAAGDKATLQGIFRGAFPFLIAFILLTILYIFVPSLSTFIPDMLYGAAS